MVRPGPNGSRTWSLLALLTIGAASACGRPHVKGTVAVDTILKAWSAEGFDTKQVVNVEPDAWQAGACSRGVLSGLDVLLCEYATDEALTSGEEKVTSDWAAENVATGAVVRTSRTLLALTDRGKSDPEGRTIARLIKTFSAQR